MTSVPLAPADLQRHYERVYHARMQGLPFVNPALAVATIGFRAHGDDQVGVLLTPWYMNLVVLPGDATGYATESACVEYALPGGVMEMTVHCADVPGRYLSALLYRDVTAIPDMTWARRLAEDILLQLFDASAAEPSPALTVSRRALFTLREET
jgi:[NiFe] hydrogenase assembly HybE family chaperone